MKIVKSLFILILLHSVNVEANSLSQWSIIPAESSLTFTATQNNAPVTGAFKEFTASIESDLTQYQDSKVGVVVSMNSITTTYAELTSILLSADWFNAKEFPKAEFESSKFTKIDDKHYEAMGTLTIKGKSSPATLTFTLAQFAKDHFLVEGSTTIKRSTFGIGQGEWASTTAIKDDVTIAFKVSASLKK